LVKDAFWGDGDVFSPSSPFHRQPSHGHDRDAALPPDAPATTFSSPRLARLMAGKVLTRFGRPHDKRRHPRLGDLGGHSRDFYAGSFADLQSCTARASTNAVINNGTTTQITGGANVNPVFERDEC
jgi:hypothetical protein